MRHVVYSAWRVFCSCFFKALGRASGKTWILKGTPRFFFAQSEVVSNNRRKKRSDNEEVDIHCDRCNGDSGLYKR